MKKVLIACEFSGVVREAFNSYRGIHATSCDLLPSEDGKTDDHYQGDVRDILNDGWDAMIAFPPCTYTCSSGLHWNKRRPERAKLTEKALRFDRILLNSKIPRIAMENPIGCISTRIRVPEQIVQPWMFGEDASKATCLWLKNLPTLKHTKIIPPKGYKLVKFASDLPVCDCCEDRWCDEHNQHFSECDCYGPTQDDLEYKIIYKYMFARPLREVGKALWSNQTPSGQNKLGPSDRRWMERSRTYSGIANAMARQWVPIIRGEE